MVIQIDQISQYFFRRLPVQLPAMVISNCDKYYIILILIKMFSLSGVALEVFNKNIRFSEKARQNSPDFKVSLHYEFLDDVYASWNTISAGSSTNLLQAISESAYEAASFPGNPKQGMHDNFFDQKENHPLAIMVSKIQA